MSYMNFSQHVLNVFANHQMTHEQMTQLMTDVALGREIYDPASGKTISKAEANDKIYKFSCEIFGVDKNSKGKELRRALEDHGKEFFRIIEDTVDVAITTGYGNEPWFEALVESKNLQEDDRQDFLIQKDTLLALSKVGNSHHDLILQRISKGQRVSISTEMFGVKIGEDINKYLLGQTDWSLMIETIAKTFVKKIQEMVYGQLTNVSSALPAAVKGSGALDPSTNKDTFDGIIEKVSAANDGAEVIIMGTKPALKKITVLADVDWGSKDQRDSMMTTGTLGIYEGTRLVVIPQRYKDKTLADASKMMSDKKLYFFAVGSGDKPIKFIDQGDTRIAEVPPERNENNGRQDDIMAYEVQRAMGVGVALGGILGEWTLP